MKFHGGRDTDFLEHFQSYPGGSRLLRFSMQTDLGKLYFQKSKTHNYVEVVDIFGAGGNNIWVSLRCFDELKEQDYFLNTDLRSLIAMFDWDKYLTGEAGDVEPNAELLSYFFSQKVNSANRFRLASLDDLRTWTVTDTGLRQGDDDSHFVHLYNVQARTREVPSWVQPLLGAKGRGYVCLYRRSFRGAIEYLVSVNQESGIDGGAIISPSVVLYPGQSASECVAQGTLFRHFRHSEEGGRFINYESDFEIRCVDPDFPIGANQFWLSPDQLKQLFAMSNMVAIQLRVAASALIDELNPKCFERQ
jgi:oxidase EvaA